MESGDAEDINKVQTNGNLVCTGKSLSTLLNLFRLMVSIASLLPIYSAEYITDLPDVRQEQE